MIAGASSAIRAAACDGRERHAHAGEHARATRAPRPVRYGGARLRSDAGRGAGARVPASSASSSTEGRSRRSSTPTSKPAPTRSRPTRAHEPGSSRSSFAGARSSRRRSVASGSPVPTRPSSRVMSPTLSPNRADASRFARIALIRDDFAPHLDYTGAVPATLTLLRNAEIYDPGARGRHDVLVSRARGGTVLAIERSLRPERYRRPRRTGSLRGGRPRGRAASSPASSTRTST